MLRNTPCDWLSRIPGFVVVCLLATLAPFLLAQTAGTGTLTGKVADASGGVLANVTVTATSVDTGQTQSTITGTEGTYKVDLQPGNYRVKFEAADLKTVETSAVTVDGARTTNLDEKLVGEPVDGKPTPASQDNLPNAPSSSTTAPSLEDLGISPAQTQGSVQDQARLDKRTHMLKIHQRLGLITLAPCSRDVRHLRKRRWQEH
jgi:hypothetical protein